MCQMCLIWRVLPVDIPKRGKGYAIWGCTPQQTGRMVRPVFVVCFIAAGWRQRLVVAPLVFIQFPSVARHGHTERSRLGWWVRLWHDRYRQLAVSSARQH